MIQIVCEKKICLRTVKQTESHQQRSQRKLKQINTANNLCVMGNIVGRHTRNWDASRRGDVRTLSCVKLTVQLLNG